MDNIKLAKRLLKDSDYLSGQISDFSASYIEKLVYNLLTYVDSDISVGKITKATSISALREFSEPLTGKISALSALISDSDTLLEFSCKYSGLSMDSFEVLAMEYVQDFLNFNNSLFLVYLSENNIDEMTINYPKEKGNFEINSSSYKSIVEVPVNFSFGTIKFIICESDL